MNKVLLVRPRYPNFLSQFELIRTEPLELEYLATVCSEEGFCHRYYDGMVHSFSLKKVLTNYTPDLVAITGYITAQEIVLHYAELVRKYCPNARVIVGGPHAEINTQAFQKSCIDYIVICDGVETFRRILKDKFSDCSVLGTIKRFPGDQWIHGGICTHNVQTLPLPDRTHFLCYRSRFVYMDYGPVALTKMGYGCPHTCPFCYCRLLNQGNYARRPMDQFVAEIIHIETNVIWIVDDCFLTSLAMIKAFADAVSTYCPDKRFIIYSRSDFIVKHTSVIQQLEKAGVVEVIVGFEAITEDRLSRLGKKSQVDSGEQCAKLLAQAGIRCTGLFIVSPEDSKDVFKHLNKWIQVMNLHAATLSVLTPIPGTPLYDEHHQKLTTRDWRKWDLIHLVMKPTQMSRIMFYLQLYGFYVKQVFQRQWQMKLIPRILLRRLPPKTGKWDFWAKHYERLWVQRVSLGPTRAKVLEKISTALEIARQEERPLRVLDMGCGTGQLLRDIQQAFPLEKIHCTGVDSSSAMIALANERDGQATYLVSDVNIFESEKRFDVITCCHSFPYYADQQKALRRFETLLHPEGLLMLAHASPRNTYDRFILSVVKLTTSSASYPSPKRMCKLAQPIYGNAEIIPINRSPFMCTILLFCWEGRS